MYVHLRMLNKWHLFELSKCITSSEYNSQIMNSEKLSLQCEPQPGLLGTYIRDKHQCDWGVLIFLLLHDHKYFPSLL